MAKNDFVYALPEVVGLAETRALMAESEKFLNESSEGNLLIDCLKAELITSLTLGAIVKLHNQFRKKGRDVLLSNLSSDVMETLRASSLIHILKVEKKEAPRTLDIARAVVNISLELDFELCGDIGIFKFGGSMLTPSDSELFFNMAKQILADGHKMLIDMSELVYIDSMGIGSLIRLHQLMREQKGEIRICSPGDILKDLLEKQNLSAIIKLYETRDSALKGWA